MACGHLLRVGKNQYEIPHSYVVRVITYVYNHTYIYIYILIGGFNLPLWKIWVRQLRFLFPTEWNNKTCSKPPTSMCQYIYIYKEREREHIHTDIEISRWLLQSTCRPLIYIYIYTIYIYIYSKLCVYFVIFLRNIHIVCMEVSQNGGTFSHHPCYVRIFHYKSAQTNYFGDPSFMEPPYVNNGVDRSPSECPSICEAHLASHLANTTKSDRMGPPVIGWLKQPL